MSRIDDLIAIHCPHGVRFKRLGDIVRIKNGKDHKALDDGNHPVYGSGGIMRYVNAYAYDKPSVLIPRKGSLGNLFYVDVPFWNVDTIFYTEIDVSQVLPKFLYYFLTIVGLGKMNQAGGVPSQTQSVLNELKIPVPPLEIQREIVEILDTFTEQKAELTAKLAAERDARRQQYKHYRDALLQCDQQQALGELGQFIRGRRFTKADYVGDGIPSIHYGEIYTHYHVATSTTVLHVRADLAKQLHYAQPGDVIIASVGETVEDVGKAIAWLGEGKVAIHDDCFLFRHAQNPRFVSYCFQADAFHAQKNRHVARSKIKRLSGESLAKIRIPVPPLEEQARIVGILDKLDALVNDLCSELQAEIAARQQQYEYYRDRLLTFREVA